MKRILLVLGIVAQFALVQAAQAVTITFGDSTIHWAEYAQPVSDHPELNSVDYIGSPEYTGGTAIVSGSGPQTVLDSIYFNDNAVVHASHTYNQWLATGDLFIDVNADSTWDFLVNSNGKSFQSGLANLYNITSLGITTGAVDSADYSKGYIRRNQPVALNSLAGATKLGSVNYSGYYDMNINSYSVGFDFGALALNLNNSDFIVGFSSGCGNDVILEQVPVPEPGTMMLFGIGMLGMVILGKRRMNRNV